MESDEHVGAFMAGFEFALLGIEGRIRDAGLDAKSQAEVAKVVRDYRRIMEQYRTGRAAAPAASMRRVPLVVSALLQN